MKSLTETIQESILNSTNKGIIEYILERRGVVTGDNSWSKVVDYIYNTKCLVIDDPEILSPWMHSIYILPQINIHKKDYYAAYRNDLSEIIDGKLKIFIDVTNENYLEKGILDHEIQHAFDDWIARVKRNKPLIDSQYELGTGYEKKAVSPYNCSNPLKANCNDFFNMFKWCTYLFNTSEVNAFSREFDRYLSEITDEVNMYEYVTDINDDNGSSPMTLLNTLHNVIKNKNLYIEDNKHVDWDYIAAGLHQYWSKKYLGKNIIGKDSKDIVIKTIQYIIDYKAKYAFEKFRKIIENHMMEGMKVYDFPWWWKK